MKEGEKEGWEGERGVFLLHQRRTDGSLLPLSTSCAPGMCLLQRSHRLIITQMIPFAEKDTHHIDAKWPSWQPAQG